MSQRKLDGVLKGLMLIWIFVTVLLITTLTAAQPESSPNKSAGPRLQHSITFRSF